MCWHLPHEEALRVAFFVALYDLVFEAKKLEDLLEHGGRHGPFHTKRLRHLGGCLLSVHFYRLSSVSELLQLAEDLLGLPLEF